MTDATTDNRFFGHRFARGVWWLSLLLIVGGLIGLVQALPVNRGIQAVIGWVEGLDAWGPIVYIVIYLIATVLFLPGSPFSIAAGALFGLVTGVATALVGATLGAGVAFLIARYGAREAVERRLSRYPKFKAVDRAVGEGGWRIVALLRLSPAVPFNLQNYLYGLTAIGFWPCMLATAVAMIPGAFLYVYLGYAGRASLTAAASGEVERGPGQWILLGVGLVATIAVTIYVTRLARRAIRSQTELEVDPTEAEAQSEELPGGASAPKAGTRNPWISAAAMAGLAALVLFMAVSAQVRAAWLMQWLGPPSVQMEEAYAPRPDGPTFDHSRFDKLLGRYVNENGGVDYAGLAEDPEELLAYNESLAAAPFDAMGRNEKLALLINAYNSFTLQLILEWLDEGIDSIRDIPESRRWEEARWEIGGHVWTLNEIEHREIRPKFSEPDVHWALVCAAVGCPPLRREAYTAARIEEQLEEQAHRVHTDGSRWFRYDPAVGRLQLTPIYQWFASDFEQVADSVIDYAAKYHAPLEEAVRSGKTPSVRWLHYDWALNNVENLPSGRRSEGSSQSANGPSSATVSP